MSAFYFVIGNFSANLKSQLKVIHQATLPPAPFVSKHGYKIILAALVDSTKKIEIERIQVISTIFLIG